MATEEGWLTVDGRKLYTKTWKTEGAPKARLAFVHGFSDHCNAYGILFPTLASKGIEVCGFDQAGWGRSVHKPSEKGLTGPTSRVLADIDAFLKSILPSPAPLFLMGHSMGGGEVLCFAGTGPESTRKHIKGYVLESPLVAVSPATRPSAFVVFAGKLAAKIMPHMQMVQKIDPKLLSRDPAVQKAFVDDPLCHDTGTLEGLAGMMERSDNLDSGKIVIADATDGCATSIWISHGTSDHVCDPNATKKFYERLKVKDKESKWYDGWYHKLHAEPTPDREIFANDVAEWILNRSEGGAAPTAKL